jgi:hypothetical protein
MKAKRRNDKNRREKKRKDTSPLPLLPAPESASVPAPSLHSFGRGLSNFSSRQDVHHRLITLFHGKQLIVLHMSASAYFPAFSFSHRFPEHNLLVSPLAAVAEEVCPHLSHYPSTPPALVVLSVTESL